MKELILLTFIFFAEAGRASDFDQKIEALKQRSKTIDTKLKLLGISPKPDSSAVLPQPNATNSKKNRIYKLGDLVYGETLNQIVVSGDEVPVIVRLNPGQGISSNKIAIGYARASSAEGRVQIDLRYLKTSTGDAIEAKATGLDAQGALGIEAEVYSRRALAMTGAIGSSFITGLASGLQTTQTSSLGFGTVAPTGRNALLQGLAQTTADQSKAFLNEATREKPILIIKPHQQLSFLFTGDVSI